MKKLPIKTMPSSQQNNEIYTDREFLTVAEANIFKYMFDLYVYHKKVVPDDWIEHDIVMEIKDWFNEDFVIPMQIYTDSDSYVIEDCKIARIKLCFTQALYIEFENIEGEFTVDDLPIKHVAELSSKIYSKIYLL